MDNLKNKFKVALCQMDSIDDREANLEKAGKMLEEACEKGADLVLFPETMTYMGRGLRQHAETIPGSTTDFFCEKAREMNLWIMTGSFPEADDSGKPKNTLVLIDPKGEVRCKYSKLHMFDVEVDEVGGYRESATSTAGNEIVTCDTDWGKMGFAICYDLRFPEVFRLLALKGAQFIVMPSSFTTGTGKAHWETLIRTRAIENGVYMIAPNQFGEKTNMKAYGHSMVVDPWGTVIAELPEGEGVLFAEIDPAEVLRVRKQIPSLSNRREDVYALREVSVEAYAQI